MGVMSCKVFPLGKLSSVGVTWALYERFLTEPISMPGRWDMLINSEQSKARAGSEVRTSQKDDTEYHA